MQRASLETLLARNQAHVDRLEADRLAKLEDGQAPSVVSICCSDSRVSQEGMFSATEPGWLFSPSTIGNQAADLVEGERVVDGNLLYPVQHTGTRTIAVVGHTGCGAVTAAYDAYRGQGAELAPGIARRIALIEPIVTRAVEQGRVDVEADTAQVVDQLVEVNVHEQVAFLRSSPEIPDDADVYGFVYDLHRRYGGPRGRAYLVNADGVQDPDRLRERVPDRFAEHVASLLSGVE